MKYRVDSYSVAELVMYQVMCGDRLVCETQDGKFAEEIAAMFNAKEKQA